MKVYDYGLFFENGHQEKFWLEYGPDEEAGEDRMITDWKNDKYIQRFFDSSEFAKEAFYKLEQAHGDFFILVNPPRELESTDEV